MDRVYRVYRGVLRGACQVGLLGYCFDDTAASEVEMETDKDRSSSGNDGAKDTDEAPVDGPGGDEGEGGLGATSQDSPGEVEGGGTSGV